MQSKKLEKGLLPCPFCGGKAKMRVTGGIIRYFVKCCSCGATTRWMTGVVKAKEAWNTRKPLDDAPCCTEE